MSLPRTLLLSLGMIASSLVGTPRAQATPPGGSLFVMKEQADTTSPTFEKDLKKASLSSLPKSGDGWHVYFVAYLKRAAGAAEVNLVFYDLADGKREEVNAFPVSTQPSARIIMSDVQFGPDQGFKAGHKYQVLITRLVGGKEDVYAKTTLELK